MKFSRLPESTQKEVLALLGKEPDAKVGERFGLPRQTICRLRQLARIPAADQSRKVKRVPSPEEWAEIDKRFGVMPEAEIAERFNVSRHLVRRRRIAMKLPQWQRPFDGHTEGTPWAPRLGFSACRGCGSSERKHASHGLCNRCYKHESIPAVKASGERGGGTDTRVWFTWADLRILDEALTQIEASRPRNVKAVRSRSDLIRRLVRRFGLELRSANAADGVRELLEQDGSYDFVLTSGT